MPRFLAVCLTLALAGCSCSADPEDTVGPLDPLTHPVAGTSLGFVVEAVGRSAEPHGAWAAGADGLVHIGADGSVSDEGRGDLPVGTITFVGTGGPDTVLARVHGKGLYRSTLGSGRWTLSEQGLESPMLGLINPSARPIPVNVNLEGDTAWLAAGGGLYTSSDGGASWSNVAVADSGNVNLAFTDVVADGARVVAVSMLPESLIPTSYQGLLSGRIFESPDRGATWVDAGPDFPSNHATSVALGDDGTIYVGTLDQGVLAGPDWTAVGGPTDVVDLEWNSAGLQVASGTRGLYRLQSGTWSHAGSGPMAGTAGAVGVAYDGTVFTHAVGAGSPPPEPAGGTVHVALSFHGNYYHSYRGDSPDDDGYGQDIRVIRSTLDWLEAYPELRADWDFDNY